MSRQRDLDKLLSDLRSFLLILDRESLSAAARAKKKSVSELLARLQSPPSEDAEYMIMRCLSPSPGTPQGRAGPGSRREEAEGGRAGERRPGSALSPHGGSPWQCPGDPARFPRGAEPLEPPLSPQTKVSPSPPADDSYEDAEPPGDGRTGGGDSDSSHYESYGEEEEEEEEGVKDRAHYLRWPSATSRQPEPPEPPGRPQAQLCGFLWRKRWLGQWAKQLFIVREHVLLCFRCAADLQPLLELDLRGCRVTYKDKRGQKMPHALKVTATAGEALVIGFQSRQQAEDWRKVWRLRRLGEEEEEEEEEKKNRSRQSPARSPRGGEDPRGGLVSVRLRWQRLCCALRSGALRMFPEPGAAPRPGRALRPATPGAPPGSPQNLRIRIAPRGSELALLRAGSDEERAAWLKTLQAREPKKKGDAPPPRPPRPSSRPSGGLLLRRVPTPNTYMDDPSGPPPPAETPKKHLCSKAERLQQLESLDRASRVRSVCALSACDSPGPPRAAPGPSLRARPASTAQLPKDIPTLRSGDFSLSQHTLTLPGRKGTRDGLDVLGKKAFPKLEEKVERLESRVKGRLRAGSEMNLLALGKPLTGHIAATASPAGSEGSLLRPLLKRSASARSALRPPPAPRTAGMGNVLRKTREWELKSAL